MRASSSTPGRAEYLDAAGRVLYRGRGLDGYETPPRVVSARRLAGRSGAPSLWQSTLRYESTVREDSSQPFASGTVRCLLITPGPRPAPDAPCPAARGEPAILLDASCFTHRLTVAVGATPGSRAFAETGFARRPIVLRDGVGILTLAPGESLRTVQIVRNGRTTRVNIDAPPARSQCGWTFERPF